MGAGAEVGVGAETGSGEGWGEGYEWGRVGVRDPRVGWDMGPWIGTSVVVVVCPLHV